VADVIDRAGVSRKAFYEYFADKEDCFLAAYVELSSRLVQDLVAEGEHARNVDRTRAQLARYLDVLARDLAMARAFVLEVMSAGHRSLLAREKVNSEFAELVFGHTSKDPVVRRALIGGVNDVVAGALLGRPKVKNLAALLPSLVRFVHQT
jgi:AcrR family transcriptional regulator